MIAAHAVAPPAGKARLGDAGRPAGGRDPGELAGVGAGEVGLDRGLARLGTPAAAGSTLGA